MGVGGALAIKGRAMARIYVSSTREDLREHRAKVIETLRQLDHEVVAMEDYGAEDQIPLQKCLYDVSSCDVYVGVFGWRYGYIPNDDARGVSITEREYRCAEEKEIPRLVFILEESVPWPPHYTDAFTGKGKRGERIQAFREELKQKNLVSFFTSPDDLARRVGTSVSLCITKAWLEPLKGGGSVADVQSEPLNQSYMVPIVEAIRRLGEVSEARVLKIDLREDYYWWSTRLFLVAALTAEYTSVGCLAFVTEGDRFIGVASPVGTLIALSKVFPEVAKAYYSTLRQPDPLVSPTDEFGQRVDDFAVALEELPGGEEVNKCDVSEMFLKQWLGTELTNDGLEAHSVQDDSAGLDRLYAWRSSDLRFPYVPLVREGKLESVVDRAALATKLVRAYIRAN
jgi:hypothetical protein